MPARSDERLDGLLRDVLGYVNLSSGRRDPKFLERLDSLARLVGERSSDDLWPQIDALLRERVEALAGSSAAFAEVDQAREVVPLVFEELWPAYRRWHTDLLAHQTDDRLLNPFFVGRMFEAALVQGAPWTERERIIAGALDELNDFVGYRPVAVLRTPEKIEPYPHEWVAPPPLFVRGAGIAVGPYEPIIRGALEILRSTPPGVLQQASFDLDRLDELALDPRAYDFEHPVNKRPNHQFGEWDPHSVDSRGYYRRFVLREPLLAALARWIAAAPAEREERQFDAAAVAAGTLLMASGTSGWGPEAHDSTVSLGKLVGRIAAYRDAFYARLLAGATGARSERLRAESVELRQPFGAVRGFLNAELARERAEQLARVHVALLFAQLGDRTGSERYVAGVPTPTARLQAEIECQFAAARRALTDRRPAEALGPLAEAEALLERGIANGAFADPWNILGFQGQFSLFPAVENSVRDQRVDQLSKLVQGLLTLGVDAWTAAAAGGDPPAAMALGNRVGELARWWDQFASADVSGVQGFLAADVATSGAQVSQALADARGAEAAGRELSFWRSRVADFDGPAAYSLALSALVAQGQWSAAMGLLMLWLLNRHDAPLEQGDASFEQWATRWLAEVLGPLDESAPPPPAGHWSLAAKFFDFLEANAEEYWHAPQLTSTRLADALEFTEDFATPSADLDDDEEDELFLAAYENLQYRDSTRDGVEADMLEGGNGPADEGELDHELQRLGPHLAFLVTLARLWRRSVAALGRSSDPASSAVRERISGWRDHAAGLESELQDLLIDVQRRPLGEPLPTRESLLEHDRRRGVRDALLDRVQRAAWEVSLALLSLEVAEPPDDQTVPDRPEAVGVHLLRALSAGQLDIVRAAWPAFLAALARQPLLYVPVSKGGEAHKALTARRWLAVLGALVDRLPRAGLLIESCQLLDAVLERERGGPPGPGAVSEFDRFFEATYRALLQTLLQAPAEPRAKRKSRPARELVELVQRWNHSLLNRWLTHSRLVRLSALERVAASARWQDLVTFVRRHGGALFNQAFFNYGHLRSIRHVGVDLWLEQIAETPDAEEDFPLLLDLDRGTPRKQAVEVLGVIVEAIVENYAYYREYNGTTTQSDRGENLYMLLDFLRLVASYDRICWNMRPLIAAHEVLLHDGDEAAVLWRQSLAERTAEAADNHLKRYAELAREYGLRLPSVYERLSERFVRPLAIDRLRGLIVPAMAEARAGETGPALTTLREEIDELLEAPAGSGVEAPAWITALLDEVAERSADRGPEIRWSDELPRGPRVPLTWDQIIRQLEAWEDEAETP